MDCASWPCVGLMSADASRRRAFSHSLRARSSGAELWRMATSVCEGARKAPNTSGGAMNTELGIPGSGSYHRCQSQRNVSQPCTLASPFPAGMQSCMCCHSVSMWIEAAPLSVSEQRCARCTTTATFHRDSGGPRRTDAHEIRT